MPYRSLLPWTLSLLLGVLVVGGFGLTASAQDGSGSSSSTGCTPPAGPGEVCVRVPVALQRDIIDERIAVFEAIKDSLVAELQGGIVIDDSRVNALNKEIAALETQRAHVQEYSITMPYATVEVPGKPGIAFSSFTYRDLPMYDPARTHKGHLSCLPCRENARLSLPTRGLSRG